MVKGRVDKGIRGLKEDSIKDNKDGLQTWSRRVGVGEIRAVVVNR